MFPMLQVAVTSPIFYWDVKNNEGLKIVSPTHMACELPVAISDSGPSPIAVKVTLKAPHLDNVKGKLNKIAGYSVSLY